MADFGGGDGEFEEFKTVRRVSGGGRDSKEVACAKVDLSEENVSLGWVM